MQHNMMWNKVKKENEAIGNLRQSHFILFSIVSISGGVCVQIYVDSAEWEVCIVYCEENTIKQKCIPFTRW